MGASTVIEADGAGICGSDGSTREVSSPMATFRWPFHNHLSPGNFSPGIRTARWMCIVKEADRSIRSPGKFTNDAKKPFGAVTSTTEAWGASICTTAELKASDLETTGELLLARGVKDGWLA